MKVLMLNLNRHAMLTMVQAVMHRTAEQGRGLLYGTTTQGQKAEVHVGQSHAGQRFLVAEWGKAQV